MGLSRRRIVVISAGWVTIPRVFREALELREGSILEGYVVSGKLVFEVLVK